MEQGTDEWLRMRAGKFTGSRFADLMAETRSGPGASRRNLIATLAIERLNGRCVQTYQNDAMRRGTELEPVARAAYECHTGELVTEVAWVQHPSLDFCGVSPDGYVGAEGMVELKCPTSEHKHVEALRCGAHADEYRWQLLGQLWVCERAWVDAVSYHPEFPPGLQLAIKRVPRDEPAISKLRDAVVTAHAEVEQMVAELQNLRAAA